MAVLPAGMAMADASQSVVPILSGFKAVEGENIFFSYFWHLTSAVLGQPSNASESPSVQNKEAN